ncbi:30032_t:CDS:2 [Gigaspora margarita]|uniref:30032_t:CDS:1 n=1 Tax=Gigaspora margarita TaxID=4874 RepID=A0ABN7ULK2_GIGMA|nr:30032_t:CDS:2 [Gigaspora margarita]
MSVQAKHLALKNYNQSQEKFEQKIKELKHKNPNKSNLDIYLEIAKNHPDFLIEANYKIASYYNTHGQYENALKIAKEIPEDYKNIKMLKAKCYIKIDDEENALNHYKEITNNKIKNSEEYKKFNEEVNRLKTTNKVRNDFGIWQQIAKYEDKILSAIAKKKINECINSRRRNKQIVEQFKIWDRCHVKNNGNSKISNLESDNDKLSGHSDIVHEMWYDEERYLLITCGFDKCVKIWESDELCRELMKDLKEKERKRGFKGESLNYLKLKYAVKDYNQENYISAYNSFENLANKDLQNTVSKEGIQINSIAMFYIALCKLNGDGTEKDEYYAFSVAKYLEKKKKFSDALKVYKLLYSETKVAKTKEMLYLKLTNYKLKN